MRPPRLKQFKRGALEEALRKTGSNMTFSAHTFCRLAARSDWEAAVDWIGARTALGFCVEACEAGLGSVGLARDGRYPRPYCVVWLRDGNGLAVKAYDPAGQGWRELGDLLGYGGSVIVI